MSMSNGTGLTAADVAAVVDNNRGAYANNGFGFGGDWPICKSWHGP